MLKDNIYGDMNALSNGFKRLFTAAMNRSGEKTVKLYHHVVFLYRLAITGLGNSPVTGNENRGPI